VIIRSSEPSVGSPIVIPAPESWRIRRILAPALPIIAPASFK